LANRERPIPESHGRSKKRPKELHVGNWSTESLNLALEAMDDGYSISRVAKHYGIPRTNLRDHMNGKTQKKKRVHKGF
jgi:transposase-like protein